MTDADSNGIPNLALDDPKLSSLCLSSNIGVIFIVGEKDPEGNPRESGVDALVRSIQELLALDNSVVNDILHRHGITCSQLKPAR